MLKQFLTGDTYARPRGFTLSIPDWEYYKAVILVKSSYFEEADTRGESLEKMIQQVMGN